MWVVTARALGLTVVALVLVAVMVALGWWQYGAYDDQRRDDARARLAQPPVPLDDVLGPDGAFPADAVGRPVTLSGRYDADAQIYVRGLGPAEYGVAAPLVTATGSAILVVRGAAEGLSAPPPTETVRVEGVLEPSDAEGDALDARRVTDGIRISTLVEGFDRDLYGGYVVLTDSEPREPLAQVPSPAPEPSAWAGIRNLLYAMQWWLFAGFVAFMWWRMVSEPTADRPDAATVGYPPGS